MAGLIMLVLIISMLVTLIVMLILRKGMKRILLTFIGFLSLIGLFHLSVVNTCGPNAEDVAVMKPQADEIVQFILSDGITKPLSGLSGLPYQLKNCERNEAYWDKRDPYKIAERVEDSDLQEIKEKCMFTKNDREYEVKMRFSIRANASNFGELTVENWESETAIRYLFQQNDTNQSYVISNKPHFYSFKTSGICNPMRM